MSKKQEKKTKGYQHEGHAKPVTRREFLSQGFIDLSTVVLMPSLLDIVFQTHLAHAGELVCSGSSSAPGLVPYLTFDCAGGAALMGNFVPMDKGGNLLPSYSRLGMGVQPTLDAQFGAPMAGVKRGANASKILQGIIDTTTAQTRSGLRMGIIAHSGNSDSNDNLNNAAMHIAKAGMVGSLIRSPIGTNNSRSGGNTDVGIYDPALKPLQIRNIADLQNALNYGPTLRNLPASQIRAIANATLKMSKAQADRFRGMTLADQFANLEQCGLTKNVDFAGTVSGVDPRQNASFQSIYGIAANSNNRDSQIATIVMNVLNGTTGPGTITIGGCDYHTNDSATGEAKDAEIGREIGRAIQAAAALGKPLAFQILTDGGISSADGTGATTTDAERVWTGDDNGKSMTVVGFFSPQGAARMVRNQVGYYTSGQSAARETFVGSSTQNVGHSVFLNYLALSKRMDLLEKVLPPNTIPSNIRDSLLIFGS